MSTRLLPALTAETTAPVREREGWPDSANRTVLGLPPQSWADLLARCESAGPAPIPTSSDNPVAHRMTNGGPVVWLVANDSPIDTLGPWVKDRVRTGLIVRMIVASADHRAALRDDLARRGVAVLDVSADATLHTPQWWLGRWASLWDRGVRIAAQKAADPSTQLARWRADGRRLSVTDAALEPVASALSEAEADLGVRRQRDEIGSELARIRHALERPSVEAAPPNSWWRRVLGLEAPKPPDVAAMRIRAAELEAESLKLSAVSDEDSAVAEAKTSALRQALRGLKSQREEILTPWFDGPLPPLDQQAARWAAFGEDLAEQSDARRQAVEDRYATLLATPPEWMSSGLADAPVILSDTPDHPGLRAGDYAVALGAEAYSEAELHRVACLGCSTVLVGPRPVTGAAADLLAAIERHPWKRDGNGWLVELACGEAPAWEPVADRPEIQLGVSTGSSGELAAVRFSDWSCPWRAWAWLVEEVGSAPLPPCPVEARLITRNGRPALVWDESAEHPEWLPAVGSPVEVSYAEHGAVAVRFPAAWNRNQAAEWLYESGRFRTGRVVGPC